MLFEVGPISFHFKSKEVANAAKGYVTCLVEVPAAYELVEKYMAMRPGLLVLNADGSKVDNVVLHSKEAAPVHDPEWLPTLGNLEDGTSIDDQYEYKWVWTADQLASFLRKHK